MFNSVTKSTPANVTRSEWVGDMFRWVNVPPLLWLAPTRAHDGTCVCVCVCVCACVYTRRGQQLSWLAFRILFVSMI